MRKIKRQRLKYLRLWRNWSQEYVANCIGMSQSNYSKLERGQIPLDESRLSGLYQLFNVKEEAEINSSLRDRSIEQSKLRDEFSSELEKILLELQFIKQKLETLDARSTEN